MDQDDELGVYKVYLEIGRNFYNFNVIAKSIDEANDRALDYGQEALGYDPKDWDEIEVEYLKKYEESEENGN
jgi:hypothetical protein